MEGRDLQSLLAIAERVVDEAEAIFIAGLGADPVEIKQPGDFATEVDLEIESTVRRMLIEETGIPVYGEEAGGAYTPSAVWIIDPIDGTSNYAAGNPMCAILLSLVLDDQPRIAVSSIPMLYRRLTTIDGESVRVNRRTIPPIGDRNRLVAQIGFSSVASPIKSPFSTTVRQRMLGFLADGPMRPRITGSVGVDLALTAQGIFDGAISFSPYMWDNAAGVAHVRAAGGIVTDVYGEPWSPRSTGVIAGTPSAHAEIMSTINKIEIRESD